MKRVYIAGPYTKGDVAVNVRNAMEAGTRVIEAGHSPFIPHLYHFVHMQQPQVYTVWTNLDLAWVEACHALYRLPGESAGADDEVDYALKLGIPVFKYMSELMEWLRQ